MNKKIRKVLIANRGEIACRIIKTCKKLGIETIAVTSVIDQELLHVKLADHAVVIGQDNAVESYLDIAKIVNVAKEYEADAVHPGYGFLSENAEFAQALECVDICFIGPAVDSIRAMGSKSKAKEIATALNIPIIQGYIGENQDSLYLLSQAEKIGFPLLIKANYGGGGKGMRIVAHSSEFMGALNACQREAKGAFGNAVVMLEKFIQNPRHIELQIFGDKHGNVVVLSDRDCSLQRRHQKIIEEAPAPGLSDTLRKKLQEAAIALAKEVKYYGAGTIEFLVDSGENFYFLEMNTRLQVEHPVTEEILGIDLVEWQIRIAEGHNIPLEQHEIIAQGHAIEARLYAEDPGNEFLPSTGVLTCFKMPECRVDAGYITNNHVSIYYDPMLAKIIVKGSNRLAAIKLLEQYLSQLQVSGVKTNQKFLLQLLANHEIRYAHPDVGFIDRVLIGNQLTILPTIFEKSLASLVIWFQERLGSAICASPWGLKDDWRQSEIIVTKVIFTFEGKEIVALCRPKASQMIVEIDQETIVFSEITFHNHNNTLNVMIDGKYLIVKIIPTGHDHFIILTNTAVYEIGQVKYNYALEYGQLDNNQLTASMPGRVISILVKAGDTVEKGTPLIILEAMKMEHTICSQIPGIVEIIHYIAGDFVEEGMEIAKVKAI